MTNRLSQILLWATAIAVLALAAWSIATAFEEREGTDVVVFGFDSCPPCRLFDKHEREGRYRPLVVEHVDVQTPRGMLQYRRLVEEIRKRTGQAPPRGFPSFHAGGTVVGVGYDASVRRWLEQLRDKKRGDP